MAKAIGWIFKGIGAAATLAVALGLAAVLAVGGMIASPDQAADADAIVVLGGGLYRPLHAADLYAQGKAPKVCISRVEPSAKAAILAEADVNLPPQPEIYRRLLTKHGVPNEAIRPYGNDLDSTKAEAAAFAAAFPAAKRIILVTSPYHIPRARLIFQQALPDVEVLAVSTPYEIFPARWWTNRHSAVRVVNETAKFLWYIVGGTFTLSTSPAATEAVPTKSQS